MDRKDQKFQELKQQVLEIKDDYAGKIKGGFKSIGGKIGESGLFSNTLDCTNEVSCSGSNDYSCHNLGMCYQ